MELRPIDGSFRFDPLSYHPPRIDSAYSCDGFEANIALRGVRDIAARYTDAQCTNSLSIYLWDCREVCDGGFTVFDPLKGTFVPPWFLTTFTLVGSIEGKSDEAILGEFLGMQARGCSFTPLMG